MKFPLEQEFKLTDGFVEKYKIKIPPFGFNGLGEFVYMRTYSRIKLDGKNESWWETVRRVVEGVYTIQKQHIEDYNLGWNQMKAQKSAQEMYDRIYNFKMLPAGRSLWAMGTPLIMQKGLTEALYNCSFISTNDIHENPGKPFANAMDFLMCGIGVGADVAGANKIKVREPGKKKYIYQITDDREGWVLSLELLINSFFGENEVEFDYSIIRLAGEPIKTFGGVSAGPEPLRELHNKVRDILTKKIGEFFTARDIADIFNLIGKAVVAGNVRRSAEIILGNPDEEFLNLKNYEKNPERAEFGWSSNNSIYATLGMDYTDISERIADNAEPGVFWLRNAQKYGRMRETEGDYKDQRVLGLNPCITGDTLIAVADGRNKISIRQLAQEGKDVPVYCVSDNNEISIQLMKNPRLTGYDQKIYEITLDNGNKIKTTGNHKFILSNGEKKEALDLKCGDSLKIFSKVIETKTSNIKRENKLYYKLYLQSQSWDEHRLIFSYFYNRDIPDGYLIHHVDENGLNNDPQNLNILTTGEHNLVHKIISYGENNGRYSGFTHEEIREHAIRLTKKLNRRFSTEEWEYYAKETGLPKTFSQWRKNELGNVLALSKWCAIILNTDHIDSDPRTLRKHIDLLSDGYDCYIDKNNEIIINKNCMVCNKQFETKNKETITCSPVCSNQYIWDHNRQKILDGQHKAFDTKRNELRIKQINIYNNLKFLLNKIPFKKEWINYCKENYISFEISRKSSPFASYAKLQEEAELYNHKVVSVNFAGYENVYNGTVDKYHNYAIGGFKEKTRKNKNDKEVFVFTANCGEINLESSELCNLVETFPDNHQTLDDFKTTIKYAYLYAKSLTLLNTHWTETNRVMLRNRRIGLSMTGISQFLASRGFTMLREWMKEGYDTAKYYDKIYSEWFAIPESIKITTVKPSGSISLLAGATPGIHFPESMYYIRRVRIANNSSFIPILNKSGYKVEPAIGQEDSTSVIEFPVAFKENIRTINQVSMWEQLNIAAFAQKYWSDNSVSVTVTFKKEEAKDIKHALNLFQFQLKAVSFLPKLEEGAYAQMPYEEITKEEYELMSKDLLPLDFSTLFSNEALGEKYCNNDFCVI